jgi:hypothetical protein
MTSSPPNIGKLQISCKKYILGQERNHQHFLRKIENTTVSKLLNKTVHILGFLSGGSISSMHSSITSPTNWWDRDNTSDGGSVQWSGSDNLSINARNSDASKVAAIITTSPSEKKCLGGLYQKMLDWIDPDLKLFNFAEVKTMANTVTVVTPSVDIPTLAVVFFLQEKELLSNDRIQMAVDYFKCPPWKFHHSENVQRGSIHLYPPNSQDYYFTSEDLPLCAARQVHYGKEHIRLTRFVSHENWQEMSDMYQLIIGISPDARKVDFCLFTLCVRCNYTIQFALKRLPRTVQPKVIRTITLQFKVSEIGLLVPLLPNVCTPLSETKWQTTDHDGNAIILKVSGAGSSSSNSSSASSSQTQPIASSKLGFFV